jgi:hypothetical protein
MRKNKTYETTHKSDDYHTRTPRTTRGQGKNTIIALGLLRELGQVDITLSPSLFPCRSFLLARCDADPRKNAETHTGNQEAVNSSTATMYKQRQRRTRNEESATQSAKWPAAEQELLPVCTLHLLPPYHPATSCRQPGPKKRGAI